MQAGKLRHRIVIQQATVAAPGTYGEQALSWSTFATVWAEVKPVSGGESFDMGQDRASVSHEIRIRYLAGVKPNMRVQFTRDEVRHTFKIHSILEDAFRGAEMVLSCEETDVVASTPAGGSTP
ncbi:MAG: Phage head-tail joining protein [Candidatus Latescibacteria bacterium ADurb.Bin168]|nr:MAG: Phage head-tail joining protein [Candidatus Latescibacteria bacterium ADurb.Bin168]